MRHLVFVGSTCKFVSTILMLANRVSLKYRSVNLLGGESTEKESEERRTPGAGGTIALMESQTLYAK